MENSSKIAGVVLKVFFIASLVGLFFEFWFILWILLSHNFDWEMVRKYHSGIDFTNIWTHDTFGFNVIMITELLSNILKFSLFYITLKILKNFSRESPFMPKIIKLLKNSALLALAVGLLGIFVKFFIEMYVQNELILSTQIGESSYFYISAIIFLIIHVFEKGYELQSENELTI